MTVRVTLPSGGIVEYLRYGDMFTKCRDGSLDVVRYGARVADNYAAGAWAGVAGDEKKSKKRRLFG